MKMHIAKTTIALWLITLTAAYQMAFAQSIGPEVKWLRVGSLRSWVSSIGAEMEIGRTGLANEQIDGLIWPAQFTDQNHQVGKALWIGTTNYADRVLIKDVTKVVCVGPRTGDYVTEIMPVSFKMYGRFLAPKVTVDDEEATDNAGSDGVDSVDGNLKCDRLIVSVCNSTIGITITRKVMAFTQQYHDNYYITEYTFRNTGIVDRQGTMDPKTLTGVYFFWTYRYGFGEEGYRRSPPTPLNDIGWGRNAVHQVVGTNPSAPGFEFPAHYAWYGRHSSSAVDDIGLPAYWSDGHLTASQHAGVVTLHADTSPQDSSNDPSQPRSTPFLGADDDAESPQGNNQYNESLMQRKYDVMIAGHPALTQADLVAQMTPIPYANRFGTNPGGYIQTEGYGPYTLAPGDSVRIVIAEGVAGLAREKCYEVGKNWMDQSLSTFTLPNGATTTDRDTYKNTWVRTGVDSIMATFRNARRNFGSGYSIPQPPPPPSSFDVRSGGDRVRLTWASDPQASPGFDGYEIYRAIGRVDTFYTMIFSCNRGNVVNTYDDISARRGFDYYYYIVSKDDGALTGGIPLVSSKFFTMTNKPAHLRRPAATDLNAIRVVPNPYDARSKRLQFGTTTPDRIAFFGLPPVCEIKIYTERGDLIKTLSHDDGSGDELWDQTTTYRQIIVSGLYIAVFTTPEGKTIIRKFIVIR